MCDREATTWSLIVRTFFLILGSLLLLYFLYVVRDVVGLVVVAAVFATAISPAVSWLHDQTLPPGGWRLPRGMAVLLLYLGIIVLLALVGMLVIPPVVAQTSDLILNAPAYIESLRGLVEDLTARYPWLPSNEQLLSELDQLSRALQENAGRVVGLAFGLVSGLASTIFVLVLTLYFTIEGGRIRALGMRLIPAEHRPRAHTVADEISRKLGLWLGGQLMLATVIFIFTAVGLLIIGVPYPFTLAVVAGVGEVIPMVGPIIGGIAAGAVAAFQGPLVLVLTIVFYIVLQQVESNWLAPKILGDTLGISPVVVLLALLIGASLMGLLGALIAVPVAVVVQIVVQELLLAPSGGAKPPASPDE